MLKLGNYPGLVKVWVTLLLISFSVRAQDSDADFDNEILSTFDIETETKSNPFAAPVTLEEYLIRRNALLQEEENDSLGADLTLSSSKERSVNEILMKYKRQEYTEGLDETNGQHFAGAQHFFHAKEQIEASNVFKIIKMFPKGCALHLHDSTTGSVEWIAKNLTYWPNLYLCIRTEADNQLIFNFDAQRPTQSCNSRSNSSWVSVEEFRANASSRGYVDQLFIKAMSLYTQTPELDYRDNNGAWYHFGRKIETVFGIVAYVEAMKAYYYQTLQEFYDDNVMYVENRGLLEYIYRLDQSELTPAETLAIYQSVTRDFTLRNPGFWGAKFIITPIRFYSPNKMGQMVDTAIQLKRAFPAFFAGFDIVAHEDVGHPNIDYMTQLLKAAQADVKFFFHAGESNWHNTKIDDNILDAILLNTTRIGHGTALNGRPHLTDIIRRRHIGVEVSPISGQVLKLAGDFRTHPAIPWMRKGFPIVIASDNPGMWGASGLSYDWYIAFMAMGGERSDLRFLKRLGINSIKYSAMNRQEKLVAGSRWLVQYDLFLDNVLRRCGGGRGCN